MINLVSQQLKKKNAAQYFWRLGTVSVLIAGTFLLLGIVLLVPSYFIAAEKQNTEVVRAAELQNDEAFQENKELSALVESTKKQLGRFDKVQTFNITQKFIEPLLSHINSANNIQLDHISYRTDESEVIMSIQGVAQTRDGLLSFVETLKSDELFTKVNVPVSSFVQNNNIDFQAVLHSTIKDI